jgi:hypothetical protein
MFRELKRLWFRRDLGGPATKVSKELKQEVGMRF